MQAQEWHARRTYRHADYPADRIAAERDASVSLCLPAREEAATIAAIVEVCADLRDRGVVDEVVVVDAASRDGTADAAARAGATVHQEADLLPEYGPVLGKGDAMWRGLSVLGGDVVVYLDTDSRGFGEHYVCGLVGPLLLEPGVQFVKAFYRRPFELGGEAAPEGGGRVTELTARPLINLYYPELAGLRQPLAGEVAARRELLARIPYATGYAVEIAMLIDAWSAVGLDAIAQVDLDVRQNRHQPLRVLSEMAYAVLCGVAARLEREGRASGFEPEGCLIPEGDGLSERTPHLEERPPMASLAPA